jgi:predicted phosphodiesterase
MKYALIGDIHSSIDDLKAVLRHIQNVDPSLVIVGTGDIYECIIGKKRAKKEKFNKLAKVTIEPEKLDPYLTFPTVYGNQEERIVAICIENHSIIDQIKTLPSKIIIQNATITHGHEWQWDGDPLTPKFPIEEGKLVFFGHSHTSKLYMNGICIPFQFNQKIHINSGHTAVNIGSVIDHREWVLYDSEDKTIEFKKLVL